MTCYSTLCIEFTKVHQELSECLCIGAASKTAAILISSLLLPLAFRLLI